MKVISIEFLQECFVADFATGTLTWKVRPRSHFGPARNFAATNTQNAGNHAGTLNQYGYVAITLADRGRYRKVLAHRVIWALKHGEWPTQVIDHINHVRNDNRIENLRDVSYAVNARNRSDSCRRDLPIGVRQRGDRFYAYLNLGNGRQKSLGGHETPAAASAAHKAARIERREANAIAEAA